MTDGMVVLPLRAETVATALDRHADYRVLRRMREMRRNAAKGAHAGMLIGCAIDVETTGLDHRRDAIIELALQRFWADERGRIVVTGRPRTWLEDPGTPISREISELTGLVTANVAGRSIMDAEAASLIADADFVVAHNARFDRPFVEARLPFARGRPWICSMRDFDWRGHGFEGRSLPFLLTQMDLFYKAHRASTDVTALLHLLDHPLDTGGTVLREMVKTAAQPTWRIEALGAPFAAKHLLKTKGYTWDPTARFWSLDVLPDALEQAVEWVATEIYGGMSKPRVRRIDWTLRHSAH